MVLNFCPSDKLHCIRKGASALKKYKSCVLKPVVCVENVGQIYFKIIICFTANSLL